MCSVGTVICLCVCLQGVLWSVGRTLSPEKMPSTTVSPQVVASIKEIINKHGGSTPPDTLLAKKTEEVRGLLSQGPAAAGRDNSKPLTLSEQRRDILTAYSSAFKELTRLFPSDLEIVWQRNSRRAVLVNVLLAMLQFTTHKTRYSEIVSSSQQQEQLLIEMDKLLGVGESTGGAASAPVRPLLERVPATKMQPPPGLGPVLPPPGAVGGQPLVPSAVGFPMPERREGNTTPMNIQALTGMQVMPQLQNAPPGSLDVSPLRAGQKFAAQPEAEISPWERGRLMSGGPELPRMAAWAQQAMQQDGEPPIVTGRWAGAGENHPAGTIPPEPSAPPADEHRAFPGEYLRGSVGGGRDMSGNWRASTSETSSVKKEKSKVKKPVKSERSGQASRAGSVKEEVQSQIEEEGSEEETDDDEEDDSQEEDEPEEVLKKPVKDQPKDNAPKTVWEEFDAWAMRMLKAPIKMVKELDKIFGSLMTVMVSLCSGVILHAGGVVWGAPIGLAVACVAFWRWTTRSKEVVLQWLVGSVITTTTTAVSTGVEILGMFAGILGVCAVAYGISAGSFRDTIKEVKRLSRPTTPKRSRKNSGAVPDWRDKQLAELQQKLYDVERQQQLGGSHQQQQQQQQQFCYPPAGGYGDNAGAAGGGAQPPGGGGNDGGAGSNFSALRDFASGSKMGGPATATGAYIGMAGADGLTQQQAQQQRLGGQYSDADAQSYQYQQQQQQLQQSHLRQQQQQQQQQDAAYAANARQAWSQMGYQQQGNAYCPPQYQQQQQQQQSQYGGGTGPPPPPGPGEKGFGKGPIQVWPPPSPPQQHQYQQYGVGAGGGGGGPPGGPPSGSACVEAGGGGRPRNTDWYVTGRQPTALRSGYVRMGESVYKEMRRTCKSVEEYLTRFYPGSKEDPGYLALYAMARQIDLVLEEGHQRGGQCEVDRLLCEDEGVEINLNHVGATFYTLRHGDAAGGLSQLAVRPPENEDLLPGWSVTSAVASSKTAYQENERQEDGWVGGVAAAAGWVGGPISASGLSRRKAWLANHPQPPKLTTTTPTTSPQTSTPAAKAKKKKKKKAGE